MPYRLIRTLALIMVGTVVGCTAAPGPGSGESDLVDVGGHLLETLVLGAGEPAVVFDAGFVGGMHRARALQEAVAAHTLTVAYERAGLGGSEPGPEPRSASQIARELRALLSELQVPGPVILVGHSAGGMFIRVFAHRYPDMVAGLVLVDPATPQIYEHMQTTDPTRWAGYEAEIREAYDPPSGWSGQWRALPTSIEETRAAWPLPRVPVTVLTALKPIPDEWALQDEDMMSVWAQAHRDLAARIPGARHLVFEGDDHVSVLDHPDLLRTILEMVDGRVAVAP